MFTTYWNFATDTGMVPQVAEPTLPPTVTALAKAAQAMGHRKGAPQDWKLNVLVEQHAHHDVNKTQHQGAKYTGQYATKTATFRPTAHGWYTSY